MHAQAIRKLFGVYVLYASFLSVCVYFPYVVPHVVYA